MARIRFQDMRVEGVSSTSGIFVGKNVQFNWKNTEKINDGFGALSGDHNTKQDSTHAVIDNDALDTVTYTSQDVRPRQK